jgi:hypothetical protein
MAPTRRSERKSRLISERAEFASPILGTIADTMVDLAYRKIYRSERRDCTAAT